MKYLESFLGGIVAALGALVLEILILDLLQFFSSSGKEFNNEIFFSSTAFIVIAACVEELSKYIVIVKRVESYFLERRVIFASLLVGLSFSAVELILIYGQIGTQWKTYYPYIIEIAILHMSIAGIMGYLIAVGNPGRLATSLKIILLAVAIHLAFNLLALHRNYFSDYLILFLLLLLVATNIVNIARIHKKLASREILPYNKNTAKI